MVKIQRIPSPTVLTVIPCSDSFRIDGMEASLAHKLHLSVSSTNEENIYQIYFFICSMCPFKDFI